MKNKLNIMREANKITHDILNDCKNHIIKNSPISTLSAASFANKQLKKHSVKSAFLGYNSFPHVMCVSINDTVIHGTPSSTVIINEGDVVSLDFGVILKEHYSDAAITFVNTTKNIPNKTLKLVQDTKEALDKTLSYLDNSFPDIELSGITNIIDKYKSMYGIVDKYGGHGIGKVLHDNSIFVSNSWKNFNQNKKLVKGDFFTIEPMFTLGSGKVIIDKDGFNIRTKDKSLSAHFEVSVAITETGLITLT